MEYVRIPGTDLLSFPISLGAVPFGTTLDRETSFRLMDAYADFGGNMVDTAQVYANWLPGERSASETTIGQWMVSRGNRNRMIVTTKGAHPNLDTPRLSRLSKEDIAADVDGSLQRLRTDTIDLYWLHRDDPAREAADILDTLNGLVRSGKIRYFGCSNWTASRLSAAQSAAASHGWQGFSANQMMWSLAETNSAALADPTLAAMDGETRSVHARTGLAAIPYSSQAQGLFSKWERGTFAREDERISGHYRIDVNYRRFLKARELAAQLSVPLSRIVLSYLLSQPFPVIPIVGCRTIEQLADSIHAAGVRLTPAQLADLEQGAQTQE